MKLPKRTRRVFEMLEARRLLTAATVATPYTPEQLQEAYGTNDIVFGPVGTHVVGTGAGQTIAIIDSGDDIDFVNTGDTTASTQYPITFNKSDLAIFDDTYDLQNPPSFTVVGQTGGARPYFKPGTYNPVDAYETAMDVEWAHAMAPEASIVLIETTAANTGTAAIAVQEAVPAVGATVVSMSFGAELEQIDEAMPESIFDVPGVTFVAAAGDTGEPAEAPATYNDVVAVGASVLTLNNDGTNDNYDGSDFATWSSEVGWGNPASGQNQSQNGGGSGGGYSVGIPTPSYQEGLVIHDGNQIISSDGYRVTPDLSFLGGSSASANLAVVTIVDGKIVADGGTSLSAPCIAGLIAIADQGIVNSGGTPLSSTQALTGLYSLPSYDYHDILSGFNGFSAGPGYDLVSGLGTPIANQWVPDLARSAQTTEALASPVLAQMNYESPETYATGVSTPIADNLVLSLGTSAAGPTINITNNGVLVDSDLLADTTEININGADRATDTLTINFSGGNMIPADGINFDGTAYAPNTFEYSTSPTGGPQGATSIILTGTLPKGSASTTSTGAWNNEVDRPLSPDSGLITLGGISFIGYSNVGSAPGATVGSANYVAYPILDQTPANDATFIALGSNNDTLGLAQVTIGGSRYTELTSTGGSSPLFLPEVFENKTDISIADADGNDTLNVNFNSGNPLPAAGLTFNGGTGTNTVNVTGNNNFILGSATLTDSTTGGGGLSLLNVQNFTLTGGAGNNTFTLDGWTGTGTINGGGGTDTVNVETNSNMGVNGNMVGDSAGMLMTLNNIAYTVMRGGTGNISFTVNAWSGGTLYLNGGTGTNTFDIGTPQTGNLDTILKNVGINAFGSSNSLVLYDGKNNSFVNYTISGTSITSKLQTIQGGGSRPFAGVSLLGGTLQSLTLDANLSGSTFNLTPDAETAFIINGAASTPTANYLNVTNVNSASTGATLFNTNTSGTNGIFMFPMDKSITFTNMSTPTPTNYTGSTGAVNAVAATTGPHSQPTVQIINSATGQTIQTLTNVYPAGYSGGVQVAIGYITGNGIPDVVVAPGVGTAPIVKVYSVLTGQLVEQFLAQSSSYNYGLQVAVGDVTGNGRQDIITASMVGAPFVNVFLNNGSATSPFAAYSSSTPTIKPFSSISGYQGGVGGLAVGNLTNNPATASNSGGAGDIIVGSGIGTNAIAQVFNYHANGTSSTPALTITPTFSSSVTGGVSVAVADVTGDGTPDLVMGSGPGGSSLIDVWNGKTKAINQFTAFTGNGNTVGLHVAIAKINGADDILVSQGTGGGQHELKVFTANASLVDTVMENSTYLEDGINVG